MARTDPQVNFRIPAELLEQIKEAAATNNRTITAELVDRLQSSFSGAAEAIPEMSADAMAVLLRSRLTSVEGLIRFLEESVQATDFEREHHLEVIAEVESLQGFATNIRHALAFVLRSKYSGADIPDNVRDLVSELSRLSF